MTRDGSIYLHDNTSVNRWKHGTARTSYFPLRPDLDIVAYTPKASPQPNDAGLREALEPFAKYADGVGHFTGPSTPFYFSFSSSVVGDREITEEDFRRARAALASTSLGDGA
jgi:hypothetical protein